MKENFNFIEKLEIVTFIQNQKILIIVIIIEINYKNQFLIHLINLFIDRYYNDFTDQLMHILV